MPMLQIERECIGSAGKAYLQCKVCRNLTDALGY